MQVQDRSPTVSDAVLALKRVLGDRAYNERRGFYNFYIDQILDMYGQQNLAEDANELPAGSLGSMPTTDYVKNMYSTAAERGMAAPDPDAVRNQMVRNPKGDVDISGTFNKGMKALQNPELGKVVGQLKNFVDKAETDYINHPVATGTGNETPQMYTTPLTQKPNYLDSSPASGTGKETPKLDTRPATARPGANYNNMMQPMEEEEDDDQDVENNISFDRLNKTTQTAMPTQSTDTAPKFPLGTKWQYVEKDADQPAAAGGNTVPVRMSMTMGNGAGDSGEITSGSKGRIDQATIDRARAWAAKMNPAPSNRTGDGVGSILNSPSQIARSQTTAPAWQDIAQANKLANPDRIYPGQQIKLPNGTFAVVDKGDTLSGIANRYRQGGYNAGAPAGQPRKTSVRETDTGDTMDDGFKWGGATMPMQDGSTMQYHAPTNSYKQATPPTRPDLNTNISTISRDATTGKNGPANRNYSDVTIATNPATGTGDYMHRQDVNGVPTTTFQKNVPAAELAKLQSQHFNEDINRMQNLAGIRKK